MNILYTKCQQSQENQNGFLLIPGDVVDDWQIIDIIEFKYFFEFKRDHSKAVGVIALSGIKDSWDAADIAKIKFVISVLRAAGG
jgi:hypothetical protein